MPRFVSVGECMIEMSGGEDGTYRLGYAGDTLNTAWYARARLPKDWDVDYVTALGDDLYSQQMRDFFNKAGIGTDRIQTIPNRRPGLYLIHQKDGDRHFTYWRGQSAAKHLADDSEALNAALAGADIAYFSGISLAILNSRARGSLMKALHLARESGARIAFDPNERPVLWTSPEVMASTITAGAPSHTPMHSANSTVIRPSSLVPPGLTCSFSHTAASTSSPPRSAHARPRHTHSRVLPSGCCSSRKMP
jgi:2-dehydro-3-deoxygluconokinase